MQETKRRKRAPLSCLQCKRRKVKCDKERPACGGCVRNGVGHLCEFVDPAWLVGSVKQNEAASKNISLVPEQDVSGYEQLVERQRAEIDELRREVGVLRQVYSSKLKSYKSDNERIVVLQKLRNVNRKPDTIKFDTEFPYSLKTHTNSRPLQLFCWQNIINLDAKLTDLWFKVSNIQRAYHQFKKERESSSVSSIRHKPNTPSVSASPESTPIDKEIAELKPRPVPETDEPLPQYFYPSVELLKRIQHVWQKILSLSLPDEKLSYDQLTHILDYFFSDQYSSVTQDLLKLYEPCVRRTYSKGDYGIKLNIINVPQEDDESLKYNFFRFQLVYLCMMGMVVEECLDHFRAQVKQNTDETAVKQLRDIFSNRVLSHSNGHSRVSFCTLMLQTLEYVKSAHQEKTPDPMYITSPFYTCCVALLNRMVFQFCPRYHHLRREFLTIFNILVLELICDGNLPLWTNPKYIEPSSPDAPEEVVKKYRDNFGYVWNEVIHMFNLQAMQILFSRVPHKQESQLFNMVWDKILNDPDRVSVPNGCGFSYAANVLICRITSCLYGCTFDNANKYFVSTANIFDLINDCTTLLDDDRLKDLEPLRQYEYRCLILFLRYYLNYINLLQGEESDNPKVVEFAEISIVQNAVESLQSLTKCFRNPKTIFAIYLASEILPYTIQFNIGLTIRLENKDQDGVTRISNETTKVIQKLINCDPADYCNYKRYVKMWDFFQTYVCNYKVLSFENYASLHSGIPGMLGGCPVLLADPLKPPPDPNGPHGSCPISGICNVETELMAKKSEAAVRCPIDHSNMPRGIKSMSIFTSLPRPSTPSFPPLTPLGTQALPPPDVYASEDIDWSNFADFDLDILPQLSMEPI